METPVVMEHRWRHAGPRFRSHTLSQASWVGVRVRVRVRAKVRAKGRVRAKVRAKGRVRAKVMAKGRVRAKVRAKGWVGVLTLTLIYPGWG